MDKTKLIELLIAIRQAEQSKPAYPPALLTARRKAFIGQIKKVCPSAKGHTGS